MDKKHLPIDGGTIVGICGNNFALIAANTPDPSDDDDDQRGNKSKLKELTPYAVLGTGGSTSDMLEFTSSLTLSTNDYKNKHQELSTEALVSLTSSKLFEERANPYAISCVVVGLDKTGHGVVQMFNRIGYPVVGTYCCAGDGRNVIEPVLDRRLRINKNEEEKKEITAQEAIDLAYECFKSAAESCASIGKRMEIKIITENGIETQRLKL